MPKIIRLLLLSIALFITGILPAQQKYALLVGINKYYVRPGALYPKVLQGCVNDALSIQSVLENRFGFNKENLITLFDDKASKANVLAAFDNVLSKIKAGDAFVFFFSGHGVWMSNNDQSQLDQAIKDKMNQAMVMSDLYAKNLDCLFTDGLLKKTVNRFIDKRAIVTTIFDCCFSGKLLATFSLGEQNPYAPERIPAHEKSFSFVDVYDAFAGNCLEHPDSCNLETLGDTLNQQFLEEESTRAFNLNDNLVVNNSEHVIRPAERPQSMFASLAGTDDRQKGLEIKDETGTYHGAYTRALLYALQKSSSNTSLKQIIELTDAAMQKQLYQQTPMYMNDPSRLSKNLIGIAGKFNDITTVKCGTIAGGKININGGTNNGIATGNLLSITKQGNRIVLEIESATATDAVAKPISGKSSLLKPGDQLQLTSAYTRSAPLIKVFIEDGSLSPAAFQQLFNKEIIPLTKLPNYWDYENWYAFPNFNILFNRPATNPDARATDFSTQFIKDNFLVYLPIPNNISSALKKAFAKNQNFQLVNKESEADYSLILNYTKAKPGFVFTWVKLNLEYENNYPDKFNKHNVKLKTISLNAVQVKKLIADIFLITANVARSKSNQWLNEYPVR